jgi:hypothetical protein
MFTRTNQIHLRMSVSSLRAEARILGARCARSVRRRRVQCLPTLSSPSESFRPREFYAEMGWHRKLGELALADVDLDATLESFRKPAHDEAGEPFRGGLDHDRLMVIAFVRRDWPGFIDTFRAAEFEPADERQVVFSSMACSAAPWARRLAIAVARSG